MRKIIQWLNKKDERWLCRRYPTWLIAMYLIAKSVEINYGIAKLMFLDRVANQSLNLQVKRRHLAAGTVFFGFTNVKTKPQALFFLFTRSKPCRRRYFSALQVSKPGRRRSMIYKCLDLAAGVYCWIYKRRVSATRAFCLIYKPPNLVAGEYTTHSKSGCRCFLLDFKASDPGHMRFFGIWNIEKQRQPYSKTI